MDENEVVAAVCSHLESRGFRILQRCSTSEQGIDVIAESGDGRRRILVEAKGGTSSREGSNRFGKPYTQSQVFDRCGKGLFTALQLRAKEPESTTTAVLATPDTPMFRRYLGGIASLVRPVGVTFWLVNLDGKVAELEA